MTILQLLQHKNYPKKVILEKLVCHSMGLSKEQLFTQADTELTHKQLEWIQQAYYAYTIEKQPLEYILGHVTFAGLDFQVTPATLIPRPETEYMIEAVREHIQNSNKAHTPRKCILLDIGTGCGVLGLSTLYHHPDYFDQAYLTDLSEEALKVAKSNYIKLLQNQSSRTTTISFLQSNLLDHPTLQAALQDPENEIIIVANLPYIPDQLFDDNTDEGVKKREPKMAFVGGDDGLDLYRIMLDQLLLTSPDRGGRPRSGGGISSHPTLFLEMMTRQVDILRKEYKKSFHFEEVKTFHFNIRIVKAILSNNTLIH